MHEQLHPDIKQLQTIHHFFPESDIPEDDLRLLSVLEAARIKGLYVLTIKLLLIDAIPSMRLTTHRPTVPSLLWLLSGARPTTITKTDALRIDRWYDPKKEHPRAAGTLEHPKASLRVISLEEKDTKSPRGLVFYPLESVGTPYKRPVSNIQRLPTPQGI
jgi:hypothetical protein